MKYEAVSLNTKKMLAAALKEEMGNKPLSKITVSELVRKCGVNRKTFYYHFTDIYDLLKWMLDEEAVEVVKKFDLMLNAEEAISFVIDYVEANQHILNCIYDSMGRAEMRRFFSTDFTSIISGVIDRAEEDTGAYVDEQFKHSLSEFCTEALTGMMINLFTGTVLYDRAAIQEDVLLILRVTITTALRTTADELRAEGAH